MAPYGGLAVPQAASAFSSVQPKGGSVGIDSCERQALKVPAWLPFVASVRFHDTLGGAFCQLPIPQATEKHLRVL